MDEELERAEERVADVQLAQAQAASLLKPDAGRDDIFHAARQGLAGVSGKIAPIGWWDSRGQEDASPELELQALNDGSRAQLVSAVMLALKETLENIEENNGSYVRSFRPWQKFPPTIGWVRCRWMLGLRTGALGWCKPLGTLRMRKSGKMVRRHNNAHFSVF